MDPLTYATTPETPSVTPVLIQGSLELFQRFVKPPHRPQNLQTPSATPMELLQGPLDPSQGSPDLCNYP